MDTSPAVSFVSKTSDSENADSMKNGKNVRFNDSIDICYIEICKDEKEFKKGKKPQKNIFGGITKKITRVNMYDFVSIFNWKFQTFYNVLHFSALLE